MGRVVVGLGRARRGGARGGAGQGSPLWAFRNPCGVVGEFEDLGSWDLRANGS